MRDPPDFKARRERLIESLKREGYIKTAEVERAFLAVPREEFVTEDNRSYCYADNPLPILCGQTISAPSMIAIMLEEAEIRRGMKTLEIGTGSGYNAALLAELVGQENLLTIERYPELVEWGGGNLTRTGYGKVKVIMGDGTRGYEPEAPYDLIMATAGAPRIPKSWVAQTKVGGRIVAPIGSSTFTQTLAVAKRLEKEEVDIRWGTPCAFVPLVGAEGWR
jgi:protein-L-isoaspartate(D-aspartate) O-methyltransferase